MSILSLSNKQAVRAPVNPMDKSTVVSILPKLVNEVKHTIQPGQFTILPGSYEKPAFLVVGSSSWFRDVDENQPLLEIPISSVLIAESIVKDYCNGMLACDMADAMPGLFFVPGVIDYAKLIKEHKSLLDRAVARQKNWFTNLVKLADSLWARSNGNPLAIAFDMKLAARELGLKEKPWLKDFVTIDEMVPCTICGTLRNINFPMCPNCKTILDEKKFKELGLKVAG